MTVIRGWLNEYAFLSNFYPCRFEYAGIIWPSSEHAYVAEKTRGTPDWDRAVRILLQNPSPAAAKRFGKRLKLREDWFDEGVRVVVMRGILKEKFRGELLQMLLATGDAVLDHFNSWKDDFWGTVMDKNGKITGKNWLGVILMEIREENR